MKADYDKYEPYGGGFRALINADFTDPAKFGTPVGVGLNANGRVVVGAGQTGIIGVLVVKTKKKAGAVVDVQTSGEITGLEGFAAGAKLYALGTTGAISTTATGGTFVGFTAEADRLIVRVGTNPAALA